MTLKCNYARKLHLAEDTNFWLSKGFIHTVLHIVFKVDHNKLLFCELAM